LFVISMLTVLGPTLVAVVADAFFPGGPGIRYALSIVVPAACEVGIDLFRSVKR
jgi:hypothetical protein